MIPWEDTSTCLAITLASRHSQSNPIELYFNRTQSNSIDGLSSIDFGNRTKSNTHKKNWTIELNRTFDFRTLHFCKKLVLKIDNKVLEARVTSV